MNSTLPTTRPQRLVGTGHAFRAEGLAGSINRGLWRVHQFSKTEMFAITTPQNSNELLDEIVGIQEEICNELGISYRVCEMPANDLGAPAFRKVDIEAWIPSRQDYGEICSASSCTDYQSRRLSIRIPTEIPGKYEWAHTVNGTAVAVPRVIAVLLENGVRDDGRICVPEVLWPFMMGIRDFGVEF